MEFLNEANGIIFNHLTAKGIAYLAVEGVAMKASDKEWRRIKRRLRQMGLTANWSGCSMTEIMRLAVDCVIEEAQKDLEKEVDSFLEDMYIMGFLEDDPGEDEDE